jgi:hypothetical protein
VLDRLLARAHLAGEGRRVELGEQAANHRAGGEAELGGELVAAHEPGS